jgi:hypothetical protein
MLACERGAAAQAALQRFSGLGHFAVAIVIATGLVNGWLLLRDTGIDVTSPYQGLLLAKGFDCRHHDRARHRGDRPERRCCRPSQHPWRLVSVMGSLTTDSHSKDPSGRSLIQLRGASNPQTNPDHAAVVSLGAIRNGPYSITK